MRCIAWTGLVVAMLSGTSLLAMPVAPRMVRWSDPVEGAFTLSVPAGWSVRGGTHRNSPIDARNYVTARRPDGKIVVFIDSPDVLPRQVPHPAYYALGWYPGRVVNSQAGPLMIEAFQSGAQYAREFILKKVCGAARAVSEFNLGGETQQIDRSIASLAMQAGVHASASAGEFLYRCGTRVGYTYAVTVLARTTMQGPQNWAVYKLAGYLADPASAEAARLAMLGMRVSLQMNPAWEERYRRQIHDTTGTLMAMSNRITQASMARAQAALNASINSVQAHQRAFDAGIDSSMQHWKQQQAANDRMRQNESDTMLGQVHGCDDLGRCATVSNDSNYHWTDPSGNVVAGASDGSPPGPQYRAWTPD